jgi:hypothetical protein
MKSTRTDGSLRPIDDCYLIIGGKKIVFNNLPDITDSKNVQYNGDAVIGRSSPIHTYAHSDTRIIGLNMHFFVTKESDILDNLNYLRLIQSCAYPRDGFGAAPFVPPVICQLKCGRILADDELCVILQNYSVAFPTEVAWDDVTFVPFKFDIQTSWWVVYTSEDLPFANRIISSGR